MTKMVHLQREWRSILKASGFPNGFPTWWKNLDNKIGDCPNFLPDTVPSREALVNISLTFDREFSKLEVVLCQSLVDKAKQNRIDNPHKIFADIRKPPVQPVVMLDDSNKVQIKEVLADNQVKIDKPTKFDPELPIFGPEGIQNIQQIDDDTLQFPPDAQVAVTSR